MLKRSQLISRGMRSGSAALGARLRVTSSRSTLPFSRPYPSSGTRLSPASPFNAGENGLALRQYGTLSPVPIPPPRAQPILPLHAVISTFDLFSIGIGPSSSHTVGPMRAAKIFTHSLPPRLSDHVRSMKISLHGSLAATGMGHMTPHSVLLGLMGEDPENVQVGRLGKVMDEVEAVGEVALGLAGGSSKRVKFDLERDLSWHLNPLPAHPNGVRFTVFDDKGDMLATNEYFSVGGGFVVNNDTQTAENLYYRDIDASNAEPSRREPSLNTEAGSTTFNPTLEPKLLPAPEANPTSTPAQEQDPRPDGDRSGQPPYLFATAQSLLDICKKHDLTIAQVVWENELAFRSEAEIRKGLLKLWSTMDSCIRNGVTSLETHLPGGLNVKRRAPGLYRRLQRGFYPSVEFDDEDTSASPSRDVLDEARPATTEGDVRITELIAESGSLDQDAKIGVLGKRKPKKRIGRVQHPVGMVPRRTTPVFPGIEYLSCMAIAVNEVNASGGRVVTAPTNGAAGVIPATLKYVTEFISQDPERDIMTFLLTASAIGMLFKRGATISAAEGGCMAEVGVACSMAAGGISACLGAEPSIILQAAEIGIDLGLTCDPLGGLVQIPCIERNSLGAVKAVTAAQLAMAGGGEHTVSLDDAIEACRTTAEDMHVHYKETSLAGLATTVKIPLCASRHGAVSRTGDGDVRTNLD